jgi:hypothetical protein
VLNDAGFAARLDLDLDGSGVCLACLSFVSIPLDAGDVQTARREAVRIAPDLWADGLEAPMKAALEQARREGVPYAEEASRQVEVSGPRALVVQAVIYRFAAELVERTRAARNRGEPIWPVLGFKPWPPPELRNGGGL